MSDFQIDGIKIFKEGNQTVVKIPTTELERISKELKPVATVTPASQSETPQTPNIPNSKTRVLAPALGSQTRGGKKRLNRRKTSKKNKME
jgi:hypothetical protein